MTSEYRLASKVRAPVIWRPAERPVASCFAAVSSRSMFSNTNNGVILIVEEASIGRLVKRMLAREGRNAIETDAAQALDFIARGDCRVKLVITNQPKAFAELNGIAPVLYLTSAPDLEVADHVFRVRILRKPFKTKDLLRAVAELTAQTEAAGG